MADIIVHPNAPVVTLTIVLDNRYSPPQMNMKCSHPMPAEIIGKALAHCISTVFDLQIQRANAQPPAAPEAPPVPSAEN